MIDALCFRRGDKNTNCAHPFSSSVFAQVTDAMKRMHERQNVGKVILLTEAKKKEEKPESEQVEKGGKY